jgi:hypothetical protein
MAEKCELVLPRASRALELASGPTASSTTTMVKVAVLLLRGGDLLLQALSLHCYEIGTNTSSTSPTLLCPGSNVVCVCACVCACFLH